MASCYPSAPTIPSTPVKSVPIAPESPLPLTTVLDNLGQTDLSILTQYPNLLMLAFTIYRLDVNNFDDGVAIKERLDQDYQKKYKIWQDQAYETNMQNWQNEVKIIQANYSAQVENYNNSPAGKLINSCTNFVASGLNVATSINNLTSSAADGLVSINRAIPGLVEAGASTVVSIAKTANSLSNNTNILIIGAVAVGAIFLFNRR